MNCASSVTLYNPVKARASTRHLRRCLHRGRYGDADERPSRQRQWQAGRGLVEGRSRVVRCTVSVRKVEMAMETTDTLDRTIVEGLKAFLLARRASLQGSVRTRMAERRAGEPRRSPEAATNAVESIGEDFEVGMLDRESREAAQIDAALEPLARDEYGICRNCGTVIGLARLRALPFAQRCTACQGGVEARERGVEAEW